jgi:hypothetical protein
MAAKMSAETSVFVGDEGVLCERDFAISGADGRKNTVVNAYKRGKASKHSPYICSENFHAVEPRALSRRDQCASVLFAVKAGGECVLHVCPALVLRFETCLCTSPSGAAVGFKKGFKG